MKTNVVITMAGFGRRFLDAGYTVPKYQIVAHDHSLFWWSMVSLRHLFATARFVFVVRATDQAADFIQSECLALGIAQHELVELTAPTNGQATTAYLALSACDADAPLSIFNIDTHVTPGALGEPPAVCDGWIPCFEAPGDHWSFVRLRPDGNAAEVRKKSRISAHATIGYYWFSSATLYGSTYESHYASPGSPLERGEAYVAPMYNRLISESRIVRISNIPVECVTAMGTPTELKAFLSRPAPSLDIN